MAKLFLAALAFASAVHAQSTKPVELYIGYSVGGGYDIYARSSHGTWGAISRAVR